MLFMIMKFVNSTKLTPQEKKLLDRTFEAAEHSVSKEGHKVGCAILCKNGDIFVGATNERSHSLGATCVERMAVDQLYFYGNRKPKLCALAGTFARNDWSENSVCTPCGVCLEMFWELVKDFEIKNLKFLCSSWDRKKFLKLH